LAEQGQFAVLLVTHDPLEAIALCSEALVLERGRLIESGALPTLLDAHQPRSETLRAFRAQLGLLKRHL
jgi:ABC-type multidrug transport system ATPase subunit